MKPKYDFFTKVFNFHTEELINKLYWFLNSLKRIQGCCKILENSGFNIQNLSTSQKKRMICSVKPVKLERRIKKLNLTGKDYTLHDIFRRL